ncbi:MAG TPA: hypothetical protein VMF88_02010 [Bacteroidota bacterium]|nr:hypothetical protein [Bacteroidota bacterium]
MQSEEVVSEFVLTVDGREQCPECGHLWTDEGTAHYHDCRYFFVEGDSEEDEYFFEGSPDDAHMPVMKTAA